jgi:hypothetical protein
MESPKVCRLSSDPISIFSLVKVFAADALRTEQIYHRGIKGDDGFCFSISQSTRNYIANLFIDLSDFSGTRKNKT